MKRARRSDKGSSVFNGEIRAVDFDPAVFKAERAGRVAAGVTLTRKLKVHGDVFLVLHKVAEKFIGVPVNGFLKGNRDVLSVLVAALLPELDALRAVGFDVLTAKRRHLRSLDKVAHIGVALKSHDEFITNDAFTNIPIRRNYRTNVSGNLLTRKGTISVTIDPEFEGDIPQDVDQVKDIAAELGLENGYRLVSNCGEDGLQILRRLREQKDTTPIIMLTARGEDVDRIVGLEMGADDYIPKPFNPRELLARIHAVLRRRPAADAPGAPSMTDEVVKFGEFELDLGTRVLRKNGEPVPLTTGEFAVLKAFARHPKQPLSRDKLMEIARGREYEAFDRSLDVQVSRLRKMIEPDPSKPRFLQTVWGVGYVFIPDGGQSNQQ